MSRSPFSLSTVIASGLCVLLLGIATAPAQQYDGTQDNDQAPAGTDAEQAPGQVARLAYLDGQVQFAPAGENDWGAVDTNRPLIVGDRLLTGSDGRAVVELGGASVRLDNDSAFDFLNLDDSNVQIELSQGTLNAAVRQLDQGENFEVDTPTVAFVAATPGIYRIDDDPSGTGAMVTVFQGSGTVYGANGVSRQVVAGTSYRFNDSTLTSVDVTGLPAPDDFDRFCEARDADYQRYAGQQQQYVPPDMIGADQLAQYGQWDDVPEYGNVWYPASVPVGWAPYRFGHWAWIDPWGWTWVDDQPWGFAPFHYGRWVYARNRWGWMPGPIGVRPVYAPALVAFVGSPGLSIALRVGGGGPVGWFPLGPRDVYVPWFHASRRYFTQVNVANIRNVYVNRTVINNFYNDYHAGRRPPLGRDQYAYRRMPGAVTAVPRNVFTGARPVHPAALRLDRTQLARTEIATRPDIVPNRASLGLRGGNARPALPASQRAFARPVVARRAPAPRPVPFAAREGAIARQHGQPLSATQVSALQRARPAADATRADRVRLIPNAGRVGASGATAAPMRVPQGQREMRAPAAARPTTQAPMRADNPAGQPPRNAGRPAAAPNARFTGERPGALPSARFAPRREPATLPHPTAIEPAAQAQREGASRLPAVRPLQRAPNNGYQAQSAPRPEAQRQAPMQDMQRQRVQTQQADQQRQLQMQNMQRERAQAQQAEQQRQIQMQDMQRQRVQTQRADQQRQLQMQNMQRERAQAQQAEQQRQVQMQDMQRERAPQPRPEYRPPAYQQPQPARAPAERAPAQRSAPASGRRNNDDRSHPER
ncbi:MAG TPA: DUF6600 domain-containing protein [Rhodanobacteraceae bacterium]|nr:DUF6600 domain-containing protein [Rhodanobacteraceae bacterium]